MNSKIGYQEQLKRELETRMQKNGQYSLRAFARDLELSPSTLSLVLSGKKGLSAKTAQDLADKLGFNQVEQGLFLLSVKASHARKRTDRVAASEELSLKWDEQGRAKKIEARDFELVNNWYHLAILELLELEDCDHTSKWLAGKLKLNVRLIEQALIRLIRVGLIEKRGIRFVATTPETLTDADVSSKAIKKYHAEQLKRAVSSLYTDPVLEREFLNMTMAFSKDEMTAAKKAIRDFQKSFARRFYRPDGSKDSVYQLSVQFFRVDCEKETHNA